MVSLVGGSNECGQSGRGYKSDGYLVPEQIDFPSKELNVICVGGSHTLVLLKDGVLYGWGRNSFEQLGLNKEECVTEPQIIEINENQEKFKYIYCEY